MRPCRLDQIPACRRARPRGFSTSQPARSGDPPIDLTNQGLHERMCIAERVDRGTACGRPRRGSAGLILLFLLPTKSAHTVVQECPATSHARFCNSIPAFSQSHRLTGHLRTLGWSAEGTLGTRVRQSVSHHLVSSSL